MHGFYEARSHVNGRSKYFFRRSLGEDVFIQQNDIIRILPDQPQIMADQQDRDMQGLFQMVHGIQKELQPVPVHTADRLIQHQQIGRGMERERQKHPLQFAAGAAAEGTVCQISGADIL